MVLASLTHRQFRANTSQRPEQTDHGDWCPEQDQHFGKGLKALHDESKGQIG